MWRIAGNRKSWGKNQNIFMMANRRWDFETRTERNTHTYSNSMWNRRTWQTDRRIIIFHLVLFLVSCSVQFSNQKDEMKKKRIWFLWCAYCDEASKCSWHGKIRAECAHTRSPQSRRQMTFLVWCSANTFELEQIKWAQCLIAIGWNRFEDIDDGVHVTQTTENVQR